MSSSQTSLTVADTTIYRVNWPIELDQETMMPQIERQSRRACRGRDAVDEGVSCHIIERHERQSSGQFRSAFG